VFEYKQYHPDTIPGEFALLKPRLDIKNAPLWGLPFLLVIAGFFLMRSFFRNAPKD